MGWLWLAAGGIFLLIMLSFVAGFAAFLFVNHQTCTATSATTDNGSSPLFGIASNATTATTGAAAPLAPVPIVAADLVLTPLAHLSLSTPQGNGSAISDLVDLAYWKEVHASEYQTYEEIIPQTVLGFFNSSQEWRDWALQHVPDSASWLAAGFVTEAKGQVLAVDPGSVRTDGSTAIAHGVQDFAASAAGVTLASLDFLSFNGLTALKVLFETHDPTLAACQTLPGQLGQLYESAFDPTVPRDVRAQYLGRALAITSVMLLVGGKDAFADHFKTAVGTLGLGDAWPVVKGNLGDVGSKVSAGAASAMLGILQTLAGRFPQDSTFVTGFTADRVDSMVDVLHEKGVPDGAIQGDIEHVAQAAGSASDEQAAGEAADGVSLQQGGGLLVKLKTGNKIVLYDDGNGRTANIRGTFLQQVIPGFDPRGPNFVAIHYREAGVTVYHYYDQKAAPDQPFEPKDTEWNPRAPDIVGKKGDIVSVSFELLTPDKFLKSVPPIDYLNTARAAWVSGFSEVKSFQLVGDTVRMSVQQEPVDGVSSFTMDGTFDSLQNSNGDTSALFSIPNVVDKPRMMKITFDGYGDATLGISSGSNYNPVTSISSDGTRLRIVSNSGGSAVTVTTVFLQDPTTLYTPGTFTPAPGYVIARASAVYRTGVTLNRGLERSILESQDKYNIGNVGAEIAYVIGQKSLNLGEIDMPPVSQGGADLYTLDGNAIIQARMLAHPLDLGPDLQTVLTAQLNQMVNKLGGDFQFHPGATTGYAILSYVDPTSGAVSTLIVVVQGP